MTTQTAVPETAITVEIDHTPAGHFQLHLSRLVQRIVANATQGLPPEKREQLMADYPFIADYSRQFASLPLGHWLAEFEGTYDGHLPLRAVREELGLSDFAIDLLLAAGLIEEDLRFGAFFAALQAPLASRDPCLGILGWLLATPEIASEPIWQEAETLARHGLIDIEKGSATVRLEWTVRAPLPLWDALRGERHDRPGANIRRQPAADFPTLDDLILPPEVAAQAHQLPALITAGQLDTLVLRGMTGSGRRTTVGAVARALGRDVLLHDDEKLSEEKQRLLGPLATVTHAIPLLRLSASPGETATVERLPGYRGTLAITMGRLGGLAGGALENALTLNLPPPDEAQRSRFWQLAALPLRADEAAIVAERFLLSGGRLVHIGRLAANRMRLAGREAATADDVREASRAVNRQVLETLATPLTAVPGWSNLVVPDRVAEELAVLEARCRGREALLAQVGTAFAHNLNRGVRALFSGPSGTGKTLAARALAGALQMDVYRVDLASVVNKYIGETEKNLNRIFTYAEELDIILLLDEGDSLMTQRTDVRGANDRYANLETNFLLQRLESYEGIILVTTNASQRIDQAFIRRLDVVVDFVLPDAEQRRLLWELHLPQGHTIDPSFHERAVQRCKLTGGQIRNAALHAALLALRRGEGVTAVDLAAALQREYRKAGQPYPLASALVPA